MKEVLDAFAGASKFKGILALYCVIFVANFLLFQHMDLFHTIVSSYTFLDFHVKDFYEVNSRLYGGNDYLPALYAVFALWNWPLHALGLSQGMFVYGPLPSEMLWSKLFLALCFFGVGVMVFKAARVICPSEKKIAVRSAAIFVTSPIAIFSAVIFGQYDVVGLFFAVTGFYYYLRKDLIKFSLFFSIAISFKYFAIVPFFPLLLLTEKRLFGLFKYSLIALAFTLIQFLFYWDSAVFRNAMLALPMSKMGQASGSYLSYVVLVVYLCMCLYAYLQRSIDDQRRNQLAVFLTILAYALLFTAVSWHPQWIILIIPFGSLAYIYYRNISVAYIFDMVGMLAFTWVVVNLWPGNVDVHMIRNGLFGSFFKEKPLAILNNDLMVEDFLGIFLPLFYIYLYYPLLLAWADTRSFVKEVWRAHRFAFFSFRFYAGFLFFLLPSLFCVFIPPSWAELLNEESYLVYLKPGPNLLRAKRAPIGEILPGTNITQTIVAGKNNFAAIQLVFATYKRANNSNLIITLRTDTGKYIFGKEVHSAYLKDNSPISINFDSIIDSASRKYWLEITSTDASAGNAVTAYSTIEDEYAPGALTVNGKETGGDLVMKLYYK